MVCFGRTLVRWDCFTSVEYVNKNIHVQVDAQIEVYLCGLCVLWQWSLVVSNVSPRWESHPPKNKSNIIFGWPRWRPADGYNTAYKHSRIMHLKLNLNLTSPSVVCGYLEVVEFMGCDHRRKIQHFFKSWVIKLSLCNLRHSWKISFLFHYGWWDKICIC